MPYVQTKIRLKSDTNDLLKDYCSNFDSTQSKVINKALLSLFKQNKEFADKHDLKKYGDYQLISVSDIEDLIFERYKVIIYIHAKQKEMIGIKLDYWPKCMGNYTILDFKERILRTCLARQVLISVLNHDSVEPHQRTLIKSLKSGFIDKGLSLDHTTYYDIWENFTP
jgi:hypothetical protein